MRKNIYLYTVHRKNILNMINRFKADINDENSRIDIYVDPYRQKWLENNIILTNSPNVFFVEKHEKMCKLG